MKRTHTPDTTVNPWDMSREEWEAANPHLKCSAHNRYGDMIKDAFVVGMLSLADAEERSGETYAFDPSEHEECFRQVMEMTEEEFVEEKAAFASGNGLRAMWRATRAAQKRADRINTPATRAPIHHDPADLAAKGYTFADLEFATIPAYPTQRRIAKRLDYPLESVTYFRHAPDSWGCWIKPGAVKGFRPPPGLFKNTRTPANPTAPTP
jgi:hypothetical protein